MTTSSSPLEIIRSKVLETDNPEMALYNAAKALLALDKKEFSIKSDGFYVLFQKIEQGPAEKISIPEPLIKDDRASVPDPLEDPTGFEEALVGDQEIA